MYVALLVLVAGCSRQQPLLLSGQIQNELNGAQVADAKVVATVHFRSGGETFPAYFGTSSDSNGFFRIAYTHRRVQCQLKRMTNVYSLKAVAPDGRLGSLKRVRNGNTEILLSLTQSPTNTYESFCGHIRHNLNWNGKWIEPNIGQVSSKGAPSDEPSM